MSVLKEVEAKRAKQKVAQAAGSFEGNRSRKAKEVPFSQEHRKMGMQARTLSYSLREGVRKESERRTGSCCCKRQQGKVRVKSRKRSASSDESRMTSRNNRSLAPKASSLAKVEWGQIQKICSHLCFYQGTNMCETSQEDDTIALFFEIIILLIYCIVQIFCLPCENQTKISGGVLWQKKHLIFR